MLGIGIKMDHGGMCSPTTGDGSATDAGVLSSSNNHIAASELSFALHAGKSLSHGGREH